MSVSGVSENPYAGMGLGQTLKAAGGGDAMGQDGFLKLLITQLQNQNPLKPVDNTEFLGQLAQISTVSGIDQLNQSFSGLAGALSGYQTLQAAQLVGHDVLVPSSAGWLGESGSLAGAVATNASGTVLVDVLDASGAVVRTLDLGSQSAGIVNFSWDGKNGGGEKLPSGAYQLQARLVQGNSETALNTYARAAVQSVQVGSNGLTLDLQGLGAFSLNDVVQIL